MNKKIFLPILLTGLAAGSVFAQNKAGGIAMAMPGFTKSMSGAGILKFSVRFPDPDSDIKTASAKTPSAGKAIETDQGFDFRVFTVTNGTGKAACKTKLAYFETERMKFWHDKGMNYYSIRSFKSIDGLLGKINFENIAKERLAEPDYENIKRLEAKYAASPLPECVITQNSLSMNSVKKDKGALGASTYIYPKGTVPSMRIAIKVKETQLPFVSVQDMYFFADSFVSSNPGSLTQLGFLAGYGGVDVLKK